MTALLSTVVIFLVLDGIWLLVIARSFYRRHLGFLMAEQPNWAAAGLFYLLHAVGVTVFAVLPAVHGGSAVAGRWRGALFGLAAYAAYDLTNEATVRNWPMLIMVVDLAWDSAFGFGGDDCHVRGDHLLLGRSGRRDLVVLPAARLVFLVAQPADDDQR